MPAPLTTIQCRIRCASGPQTVYHFLAHAEGRAAFWAASAPEAEGCIHFRFPDGQTYIGRILEKLPDTLFRVLYFDTPLTFRLHPDGTGGTIVNVTHEDIPEADYAEVRAGWVSVLLALKAAADFGVDLRNHHPDRHWYTGFVDN
ncbi:MAG: hypothetical protein J5I41_01385 [Saprospiraceae bacterium]|nr:hypothetical protein [Saprospiraceae bacterium]